MPRLVACVAALLAILGDSGPAAAGAAQTDRDPPQAGEVEVTAWIERGQAGSELVVALAAPPSLKIPAEPGVTVTPQARPGVEWLDREPVSTADPGTAYFKVPPTLRLPFRAHDGQPVEALVEYAYCVTGYQCIFGEEELRVAP